MLPIFTPITDRENVSVPIKQIEKRRLKSKKAKVTPTARASMLVAIANRSIV